MCRHWDEVWSFSTARFRIIAEAAPCEDDPAESFTDPADVESIRDGHVEWFDARVRVVMLDSEGDPDSTLGADHLGACAYADPADLFRDHARRAKQIHHLRVRHHAELAAARYSTLRKYITTHQLRAVEVRRELGAMLAQERDIESGRVCIGWYGPDMVREAIANARNHLAKLRSVTLREPAA